MEWKTGAGQAIECFNVVWAVWCWPLDKIPKGHPPPMLRSDSVPRGHLRFLLIIRGFHCESAPGLEVAHVTWLRNTDATAGDLGNPPARLHWPGLQTPATMAWGRFPPAACRR